MASIAGQKSRLTWAVHISVALMVVLWLIPTVGLLVSSFRTTDQISQSGWWESAFPVEKAFRDRIPGEGETQADGAYVLSGNLLTDGQNARDLKPGAKIVAFGTSGIKPGAYKAGETAQTEAGTMTVNADGAYEVTSSTSFEGSGPRVYFVADMPPAFTLSNYRQVLFSDGMGQAFLNTLTVTIPATIIPILVAAFAAYALAWMEFPGRGLLIAAVVGLLVVPLQLALVPLLRLHQDVGIGQSFVGIWLAHTGFGLPLAIYLLRNYMVGLPRDIIESAKVDGATDFQIFMKIVLPLSFPALASFAIFQFLWVWNDLLVAKVFLPANDQTKVMTVKIADDLLGSRGGDWGILAAAAFVSIAVPLGVFFAMQKYLVRGLLAGSVKGG
ncbi:MAG: carbohydrate ABC transporter permease [Thioclava marina]|uniref:ABC transporter permease n=1 Tax=Thioclava marina TaxID=1915077 RepID=A0ABX3MM67_9RHOB|nr:carbohydrate ABC transporter permease [Thioclava marina]MBC7144177.1 carbohydrate ABC transporter permease [Thioclava marina]OOY12482.1 ABC transporter permease [Thioclava marina]